MNQANMTLVEATATLKANDVEIVSGQMYALCVGGVTGAFKYTTPAEAAYAAIESIETCGDAFGTFD